MLCEVSARVNYILVTVGFCFALHDADDLRRLLLIKETTNKQEPKMQVVREEN